MVTGNHTCQACNAPCTGYDMMVIGRVDHQGHCVVPGVKGTSPWRGDEPHPPGRSEQPASDIIATVVLSLDCRTNGWRLVRTRSASRTAPGSGAVVRKPLADNMCDAAGTDHSVTESACSRISLWPS